MPLRRLPVHRRVGHAGTLTPPGRQSWAAAPPAYSQDSRANGHASTNARPTSRSSLIGPNTRLSLELQRLSPITHSVAGRHRHRREVLVPWHSGSTYGSVSGLPLT